MPNSIIKEVTFTPQIFSKSCISSGSGKFERFLTMLDNIADNGIIIGLSQQWIDEMNNMIDIHEDNDKKELKESLKHLNSRCRIVFYHSNKVFKNIEDNWIKQALELNKETICLFFLRNLILKF